MVTGRAISEDHLTNRRYLLLRGGPLPALRAAIRLKLSAWRRTRSPCWRPHLNSEASHLPPLRRPFPAPLVRLQDAEGAVRCAAVVFRRGARGQLFERKSVQGRLEALVVGGKPEHAALFENAQRRVDQFAVVADHVEVAPVRADGGSSTHRFQRWLVSRRN